MRHSEATSAQIAQTLKLSLGKWLGSCKPKLIEKMSATVTSLKNEK